MAAMPRLSRRTSPRRCIEDVRLFVNPRQWLTWPCSVVFIAVYNKCIILLVKWVTLNAAPCTLCPTRYWTRHFFNTFTTNEDIATKFEADYRHITLHFPHSGRSEFGSEWDTMYKQPTKCNNNNFINNFNQLNMFRTIISPILRNTRLCLQIVV